MRVEFQKVVLSSTEPIVNIVRLIDVCNECARLFSAASEKAAEDKFKHLAARIHSQFEQFHFELQTEIRRLGGGVSSHSSLAAGQGEADILPLRCEIGLQLALDDYQKALDAQLTAHARAMLKRQLSDLQQAYEHLAALHKAA